MSATDTIRIRLEPQLKSELQEYCTLHGTSVSQEVRTLLADKLKKQTSALERFNALTTSSAQKLEAVGLSEPTIDDINLYIKQVRKQRHKLIDKVS